MFEAGVDVMTSGDHLWDQREVESLQRQLRLTSDRVLVDAAATESAIKGVKGPKVLHIATHGFFLPKQPEPPPGQRPAVRHGPSLGPGGAGAAGLG